MKVCKVCGVNKPLSEYRIDVKGKFGRQSRCADCMLQQGRARSRIPAKDKREGLVMLTLGDETLSTPEWRKRLGITRQSLHKRLAQWPLERALTEPRRLYGTDPK